MPLTMFLPSLAPSLCLSVLLLLSPVSSTLQIDSNLDPPLGFGPALGINCRGSAFCPQPTSWITDYIGTLIRITDGSLDFCPLNFDYGPLSDTQVYLPGQHIACIPIIGPGPLLGGICAFAQGKNVPSTGLTGAFIKGKLRELRVHGCLVCGSVPLGGNNDPNTQGILSVNYVRSGVCRGLCPSAQYAARLHSAVNESSSPTNSSLVLES